MKKTLSTWLALTFGTLLSIAHTSAAYAQQVLHFVALENPGYTQANGEGLYWDIIKAIHGNKYTLNLSIVSVEAFNRHIKNQDVDGYIALRQNEATSHLYFPFQHLDTQYASYLLYKNESFSLSQANSTIALIDNDQLSAPLPDFVDQYRVQKLADLKVLIDKERVDAGLVFSNMLAATDPQVKLKSRLITPKAKLFVGYKKHPLGAKLANDFDDAMQQLLKDNVIKSLFKDSATYKHANFDYNNKKKSVQLLLNPKRYNEKKQVMVPVAANLDFSDALEELLGDVHFNHSIDSARRIKTYFDNNSNTCALHVVKNPTREKYAYYSIPTQLFLKPKLIIKKDSAEKYQLDSFVQNSSLSIERLSQQQPELSISAVKTNSIFNILNKSLSEQLISKLYFSDDKALNNTFDLLAKQRVDAVITYPALMVSILDNPALTSTLTSYDIDEIKQPTVKTYIACSKNEFGQQLIKRINTIVSNQNNFMALYGYDIKRLDKNSAQSLKQALYQ